MKLLVVLLSLLGSTFAFGQMSENVFEKRIFAYLTIDDPAGACEEAAKAVAAYPESSKLWEMNIKALAARGLEVEMFQAWKNYRNLDQNKAYHNEVLESMAWGIIQNGSGNASPIIRIIAMLAAFFGQDAKSVAILKKGLADSHTGLRAATVELVSKMRDDDLRDAIIALLKQEKEPLVQLALLKAVGEMRIKEARPYLMQVLTQASTTAQQRAAAIESIVVLTDTLERNEVENLASSNRAALRLLACECIGYLGLARDAVVLLSLTKDANADVRAASLQVLGGLQGVDEQKSIAAAHQLENDPDPYVAISAAWLLMVKGEERGAELMKKWLENDSSDVRGLASGALLAAGKYGKDLMKETFEHASDPFVKINLAHGLITQRIDPMLGCKALHEAMVEDHTRWMKDERGLFSYIAPSKLKHRESVPNYPETANQLLRLELLNILAMMRYPEAQAAVQSFLSERTWGVTGLASAILLTEGDEAAVGTIRGLLTHPNTKVRVQAALILGSWGGEDDALKVLQDAYATSHRDIKEQILEAIGSIQSDSVVPFLAERLGETAQSLRIIAAASLIRNLNQ